MPFPSWVPSDKIGYQLRDLDFRNRYFYEVRGSALVYVLFVPEALDPRGFVCIYVGQTEDLGERLRRHATGDTALREWPWHNPYATWAEVEPVNLDGHERFLADELSPFQRNHPNVRPVRMPLPPFVAALNRSRLGSSPSSMSGLQAFRRYYNSK